MDSQLSKTVLRMSLRRLDRFLGSLEVGAQMAKNAKNRDFSLKSSNFIKIHKNLKFDLDVGETF